MNWDLTLWFLYLPTFISCVYGGQRTTFRSHVSSTSLSGSQQVTHVTHWASPKQHFKNNEYTSAQVKEWLEIQLSTSLALEAYVQFPGCPALQSSVLHITVPTKSDFNYHLSCQLIFYLLKVHAAAGYTALVFGSATLFSSFSSWHWLWGAHTHAKF